MGKCDFLKSQKWKRGKRGIVHITGTVKGFIPLVEFRHVQCTSNDNDWEYRPPGDIHFARFFFLFSLLLFFFSIREIYSGNFSFFSILISRRRKRKSFREKHCCYNFFVNCKGLFVRRRCIYLIFHFNFSYSDFLECTEISFLI